MRADCEWDETWRTDEDGERCDFVMHVHLPPRFQVGVLMGPGGAHMAAIQRRFNLVSIGVVAVLESSAGVSSRERLAGRAKARSLAPSPSTTAGAEVRSRQSR